MRITPNNAGLGARVEGIDLATPLAPGDYRTVLRALGPVPQVALARALGVTPASTVQIVDELERLGLVERRRSTTDRRTQLLHLTPGSAAVLPEAGRAAGRAMDDVLGVLDASERSRLVALLQRFVTSAAP